MALKVGDRVKQTSTTTGTGTITLNGTAPTGFSNFRDYLADSDTTYYVIEDGTNYEIGVGTFNTGGSAIADTIARSSDANVFRSTNSNNRINWSSGTRSVFISLPSDKAVFEDALGDLSFTGDVTFTGANYNVIWDKSDNALEFAQSAELKFGGNFTIDHNSIGNSVLEQTGGSDLYLTNRVNDKDVIIQADDGTVSSSASNYFKADGSTGEVQLYHYGAEKLATKSTGVDITGNLVADSADITGALDIPDSSSGGMLNIGNSSDLQIYHNGSNTIFNNQTGNLFLIQGADNSDMYLQSDNQTGGQATYIMLDGSEGEVKLFHASSGSAFTKLTTKSTGVDVTGAITTDGLTVDGTTTFNDDVTFTGASYNVQWDKSTNTLNLLDVAQLHFGSSLSSGDLRIFHNLTDSFVQNTSGHLNIINYANDKDIIFYSDSGSGGTVEYIKIDGSEGKVFLNFYGGERLATSSSGVEITGSLISKGGIYLEPNKTITFEGATDDGNETILTVADATFDRTITLPNASGTVFLTNQVFPNIFSLEAGKYIVFEGTTDDGYETILTVADPSFDRTITLPNASGTVFLTNQVFPNNFSLDTGRHIIFEGATGDGYETILTVEDPSYDRTITLPNWSGTVFLTNQVFPNNFSLDTGKHIIFEGATGDGYETILTVEDPSYDRTITLPNWSGTVFLTNQVFPNNFSLDTGKHIIFEGSTGDQHETILTVIDPTYDRTISLPNSSGTIITTGNADTPSTTTNSSHADHVLIADGSVLKKITPSDLGIGGGSGSGVSVQNQGSTLSTTATTLNFTGAGVVASGTGANKSITISGGGSGITVQDEGSALSTTATTLNFTGSGVTASGTGATKTINITGGGGGGGMPTTGGTFTGDVTFSGDNVNMVWDKSENALEFADSARAIFGSSGDFEIQHIGNNANTIFKNYTNNLAILNYANDKDVDIYSDDGSGNTALYFRADGSTGETLLYHYGSQKLATKTTGIQISGVSGGASGTITLNCSENSHGVKIQSPDHSASQSYTLKLPDNQIAVDKILKVKSISGSGATAIGQLEFDDLPSGSSVAADDITTGDGAVSIATSSGNITIDAQASDTDIIFKGTDGASDITMLTLDASEAGNATFSGNVTAYSDERLKSNIKTIDNALDKVTKLRGVSYTKQDTQGIGVIAQEVEKIIPEVVHDGEYKSVAYGNMVGVLIEAIKEQQQQIDEQQKQIDELKKLIG